MGVLQVVTDSRDYTALLSRPYVWKEMRDDLLSAYVAWCRLVEESEAKALRVIREKSQEYLLG